MRVGPDELVGPRQVAGRPRDARVRADAATEQHDLAAGAARDVAEQAEAMDVRGEHRDHDRAGGALDERLEHGADVDLVAGRALGVDVRRVAHEERDAGVAELAQALGVEVLAVGRVVVELEVAGVDEQCRRRCVIASAVASAIECVTRMGSTWNEPTSNGVRGRVSMEARMREDLVLAEPLADEAERVGRRPDGHVVPLEEVGERADVVLVAVRDDDAREALPEALERREIRVDDVDAEPAVVERDAAVDEQHVAALLDRHAVHADLAEAAERQHPQPGARVGGRGGGEDHSRT